MFVRLNTHLQVCNARSAYGRGMKRLERSITLRNTSENGVGLTRYGRGIRSLQMVHLEHKYMRFPSLSNLLSISNNSTARQSKPVAFSPPIRFTAKASLCSTF